MAIDKDYDETLENVDDYFEKRRQSSEDYGGMDLEDEMENDDYEYSEADEDLEDAWFDIEDEFRIRYPTLTDGDVTVEPGRFQNTLARMGQRLNRMPEEIRQEIENWDSTIG